MEAAHSIEDEPDYSDSDDDNTVVEKFSVLEIKQHIDIYSIDKKLPSKNVIFSSISNTNKINNSNDNNKKEYKKNQINNNNNNNNTNNNISNNKSNSSIIQEKRKTFLQESEANDSLITIGRISSPNSFVKLSSVSPFANLETLNVSAPIAEISSFQQFNFGKNSDHFSNLASTQNKFENNLEEHLEAEDEQSIHLTFADEDAIVVESTPEPVTVDKPSYEIVTEEKGNVVTKNEQIKELKKKLNACTSQELNSMLSSAGINSKEIKKEGIPPSPTVYTDYGGDIATARGNTTKISNPPGVTKLKPEILSPKIRNFALLNFSNDNNNNNKINNNNNNNTNNCNSFLKLSDSVEQSKKLNIESPTNVYSDLPDSNSVPVTLKDHTTVTNSITDQNCNKAILRNKQQSKGTDVPGKRQTVTGSGGKSDLNRLTRDLTRELKFVQKIGIDTLLEKKPELRKVWEERSEKSRVKEEQLRKEKCKSVFEMKLEKQALKIERDERNLT